MTISTIKPANDSEIQSYDAMDDKTVDLVINSVSDAGKQWQETDYAERAKLLKQVAEVLR